METPELPVELRQVQIVHVLDDGKLITDHDDFENNYKDKFRVDEQKIVLEIIRLRKITRSWNKSILYIKTNGDFESKIDVSKDTKP